MGIKNMKISIWEYFKKYRYAMIILLVGIILIRIPPPDSKITSKSSEPTMPQQSLEEKLEDILSKLQGAGRVKVMLTLDEGPETFYQENHDQSKNQESFRSSTITITDGNHNQKGLIRQIKSEKFRGAVVLCQGADSPSIKLSVVDAVSKVTGLHSHQISVLKMT